MSCPSAYNSAYVPAAGYVRWNVRRPIAHHPVPRRALLHEHCVARVGGDAQPPFAVAQSIVARATSGERPGPWWPPSSSAMNSEGGASTAATLSLCAKGTAASSRACATSTRCMPRAAATRSSASEERPQGGLVEAAGVLAPLRVAGLVLLRLAWSGVRSPRALVEAGEERGAVGRAEQDERPEEPRLGAGGQQQHGAAHAGPSRRQPRRAGLGEQPSACGDGVPPAVRPHQAAALAVAAEVERHRGQPRRGRLLAHDLVVLLAAAGAVAHEQGALGPAGGQEEPARPARHRRSRSRPAAALVVRACGRTAASPRV